MNSNHIYHSQVGENTEGRFGEYKYSLSLKEKPGFSDPNLIYFLSEDSNGYEIDGKGYYLLGSLQKRQSNLDLWTISLMLPSGLSVSCDFLSKASAERVWGRFLSKAWVEISDLPATYVEAG